MTINCRELLFSVVFLTTLSTLPYCIQSLLEPVDFLVRHFDYCSPDFTCKLLQLSTDATIFLATGR
jgi:hypothetical protein